MNGTPGSKRPYLSRDKRHGALLDAASQLVENKDWEALTMVSLAQQAKVSRQLVYQHFASTDELMAATLSHLFRDVYEHTRDAVMRDQPTGFTETVQLMQRITIDIPAGRARALWRAMSVSGGGEGEVAALSRRLRHLLVKTTRPLLERSLGVSPAQAGPLVWMLIVSFWGARQFMDDGELDRESLMDLHGWMMDRVVRATPEAPPDVARRHQNAAGMDFGS